MKYIIFSGWWCDDATKSDDRNSYMGDDEIRKQGFHSKWYDCINKYTNPSKIVIIDSNSPVKPPINQQDSRLEVISLSDNFGHSTNHKGKMCGVTRAHLMGVFYAHMCDADYCVYIEQDALVYGKGIVEKAISSMDKPYMFGGGDKTPYATQQSFFIIRKDGYMPFIKRMTSLKSTCNQIAPENKFAIACSPILSALPETLFRVRGIGKLLRLFKLFRKVPFGYGRSRPIDFSDSHFYFQHGDKDELAHFLDLMNK